MKRFLLLIGVLLCFTIPLLTSAQVDDACAGLPAPRLVVGNMARVTPGNANNIRSDATKNAAKIGQIPAEAEFAVLAGPTCADGYVWWQVNYNGTVGWTVEGADGAYWLEPLEEIAPVSAPCTTNLIIGEPAQFDYYLDQPIREQPDESTKQIGNLTNGDRFNVIGGPTCVGDYTWVQIKFGSINGWLEANIYEEGPEGGSGLVPVAHALPRPLQTVSPEPGVNRLLPTTPISVNLAANAITPANAAQVKTSRVIGDGLILDYAWSPDDGQIAVAGTLDARVYDLAHPNNPPHILVGHDGAVNRVLYTPNGSTIATASGDGTVRLWDPKTFESLSTLQTEGEARTIAISPDGTLLAASSADGENYATLLWDISDPARPTQRYKLAGLYDYSASLGFTPDSQHLLGIAYSAILLWDVQTGAVRTLADLRGREIRSWSLDPEGKIISAFTDETVGDVAPADFYGIQSWNLETGKEDGSYGYDFTQPGNVPIEGMIQIRYAPTHSSQLLVNVGGQPEWLNPFTRDQIRLTGVTSIAFSPDGTLAVFGDSRGGVRLYRVSVPVSEPDSFAYTPLDILYGVSGRVSGLTFSPDGQYIAASGADNSVRVWKMDSRKRLGTLHFNNIGDNFAFSADEKTLFGNLTLWNLPAGKPAQTLKNPGDDVITSLFKADGSLIVASRIYDGGDGGLVVWNGQSGAEIFRLSQYGYSDSIAFSADGSLLAYGHDRTVQIINLADGSTVQTLDRQHWGTETLQFSPDNRLLMVLDDQEYGRDNASPSILIWDIASGDLLANVPVEGSVSADNTIYGSQGRQIAWITADYSDDTATRILHIVNLADGSEVKSQPFSYRSVSMAFNPDASLIVVGDLDGSIHLWDAASGQEITTLQGHTSQVTQLSFSPDGARLYSASSDHSVRVWSIGN